jgi:hypothetical protein
MGEDHEVVFVVADDPVAMKKAAKAKWRGHGRPHLDAYEELHQVDGFDVVLVPSQVPVDRRITDDNQVPHN